MDSYEPYPSDEFESVPEPAPARKGRGTLIVFGLLVVGCLFAALLFTTQNLGHVSATKPIDPSRPTASVTSPTAAPTASPTASPTATTSAKAPEGVVSVTLPGATVSAAASPSPSKSAQPSATAKPTAPAAAAKPDVCVGPYFAAFPKSLCVAIGDPKFLTAMLQWPTHPKCDNADEATLTLTDKEIAELQQLAADPDAVDHIDKRLLAKWFCQILPHVTIAVERSGVSIQLGK